MNVAVIGSSTNEATGRIVTTWRALGIDASLVTAADALAGLGPGDVALARLDVLPTLNGVEDGLLAVLLLQRRGVCVLNPVDVLLNAHDKLRTARLLQKACVPHPRTVHVTPHDGSSLLRPPLVLKPRFGSWGSDVMLCRDDDELRERLAEVRDRPWFRRHGVLAQEVLDVPGFDLRVIVAGGRVVGAVERVAAPGEWRTNLSIGGTARRAQPSEAACEIACTAAAAIGADFVGVDLVPGPEGFVPLELNAAVDFDDLYSLAGRDVHREAAVALGLLPVNVAR